MPFPIRRMAGACLLSGCLALAACGPAGPPPFPLETGLTATVNVNGMLQDVRVDAVEGERAHLSYFHRDRLASHRGLYRGLILTDLQTEGAHYSVSYDAAALAAVFPLQPGARHRLTGQVRVTGEAADQRGEVDVALSVTERGSLSVGEDRFDVLVVRFEERGRIGGQPFEILRTEYYAPSLGLSLRSIVEEDDRTFYSRVMRLDRPRSGRRNALGTVVI